MQGTAQDTTKGLLDINNTKLVKKINSLLDTNQKKINNFIFNKLDKTKENLKKGVDNGVQKIIPLGEDRPLPYEKLKDKKYTLGRRAYQNTMAQFNYLFHGEEELNSFIQNARLAYEDDFTSDLIPFYDYALSATAKNNIDSIVYRSNANIVLHDLRSNYVDDSYLLLAKAYLFHKNFDTAGSILQFINYSFDEKEDGMDVQIGSNLRNTKGRFSIATPETGRKWENKNVRNESLLWQARTYFEIGELNEGISLLQILKSDPIFPQRLAPFLNEQMAYGYYQMELYDSAATYLINALPNAPDNLAKSRWHYLIAQLWQKKENWPKAYDWYRKANQSSVNPIVGVYSKINMTRIDARNANRPWLALAEELERMGKREKYSLYKDIIYFEMAKLAIQNKNYEKANDWLIVSIKKNISNLSQKQKAFELLASINYKNDQFPIAKMAYDSITGLLKSNPNFEQLTARKKWISAINDNNKIIQEEDTLQYIYKLDTTIQKAFYTNWQKRTNKSAEQVKNLFVDNTEIKTDNSADNTSNYNNYGNNTYANSGFNGLRNNNSNNSNTGNADFYFDNKNSVAQGKQNFIKKWGERPNLDQWRRKTSANLAYNNKSVSNISVGAGLANTNLTDVKKTDTLTIANKDIPTLAIIDDSASFKLSAQKWNEVALKNAQLFLLELNDFEKAYPLYKRIIQKNIDPITTERAMLDIASQYIHDGKQNSADSIIAIVENNFPVGFYVTRKNDQEKKTKKERSIIDDYKEAYFLTQIGNWDSLSNLASSLNRNLRGTKWYTPFQFLKVKMFAQQKQDSMAILLLDSIVAQNKNESIRDRAKNIITELKRRKDTEAYLTSLKIIKAEQVLATINEEVPNQTPTIPTPPTSNNAIKTNEQAKKLAEVKNADSSKEKNIALIEPAIVFNKDTTEQYYAAVVTHKVKPTFIKEMQTAFSYLNNDEFKKLQLNVTYVQFSEDSYIVWIGPFANLNNSTNYLNKVKTRLSKEIISFIPTNQYELYLLGKSNILLIKNEEDLLLYKQFMLNNIYKP
jgi:hypothetical protein